MRSSLRYEAFVGSYQKGTSRYKSVWKCQDQNYIVGQGSAYFVPDTRQYTAAVQDTYLYKDTVAVAKTSDS